MFCRVLLAEPALPVFAPRVAGLRVRGQQGRALLVPWPPVIPV
jgi:hypothetical protein